MIPRFQRLQTSQSLFLFGARGTGKSTLLQQLFSAKEVLWIDLLNYKEENALAKNPDRLSSLISGNPYTTIVIDEIQKIPRLLDVIHREMERNKKLKFVMTGSSARKLKRGQGNLLAGRAVACQLFPLSAFELKKKFHLENFLQFGGLPQLLNLSSDDEKILFLDTYVHNYLKEEILQEQIIRNIQPFKNFLEIISQLNGQIINYSKFARETGSDHKTIQNYFSVLEDTLLGFFLPAYSRSIRKQQQKSPKFYLFDTGVKKALNSTLTIPIRPGIFGYGEDFEHFIILECLKLNHYLKKFYKFSYCKTKSGLEVDLIIQRPGKKEVLVEIKSTNEIRRDHIQKIKKFSSSWSVEHITQVWSLDKSRQIIEGIECLYWEEGLKKLF